MRNDPGFAPAKINLALHVTGKRADGYHLLDSLVVFAGVGDQITATLEDKLTLTVDGQFKEGVPTDKRNLVLQAAEALRRNRQVKAGAAIHLTKVLPHAAGVGGGSSDAVATLDVLSRLWDVEPLPATHSDFLALGADIPVCHAAPRPMRMAGIGDILAPVPSLPDCACVLVNARQPVPTGDVFAALEDPFNDTMGDLPSGLSFDQLCAWLKRQRNDLQTPAEKICPGVGAAMARLRGVPSVKYAVMSGSGGTCVGLVADMATARQAARAIQISEQGWWVMPAPLLS